MQRKIPGAWPGIFLIEAEQKGQFDEPPFTPSVSLRAGVGG
jgi:hypothetical protein